MTADRRHQISDLYHRALERPAEDRRAFIEKACAGDAALREEVESLLRCEAGAESFLATPASQVVAGALPDSFLMPNRQLGPYTIVAALGAGGMGEVYRARDTRLGRDVAIKILPSQFTADSERRARFAREARLLATLNHPHIGAIYGLEESNGMTALVLELVEGPTLADRLARAPLPVPAVLVIAQQIAEALEAAHEKGVVHRDLKPANIVLEESSGALRVKVLDFGLAKAIGTGIDLPTSESFDGTADARILGTPAYMSPEQARGLAVDKRMDIWAFGCVLFEMLTGRRAFEGETVTDTFARILEREPDWSVLPGDTPPPVRTLLERCLRKDSKKRLRDIADALIELEDVHRIRPDDDAHHSGAPPRRPRERLAWMIAAAFGFVTCALGAILYFRLGTPAANPLNESLILPPAGWSFPENPSEPRFEIAPDGRHVVLVLWSVSNAKSMLWLRSVDRLSWRQLAGTEDASSAFWSPDSDAIGFFADGKLKTVRLNGGAPPITRCDAPVRDGQSGTWNREDVILFTDRSGVVKKLPSGSAEPTPASPLEDADHVHGYPWFLPDGNHFLYLAQRPGASELRVASLTSPETRSLGPFESSVVYVGGYLLSVREGTLTAHPFDPAARQLKGDPVALIDRVSVIAPIRRGAFSASTNGVLAYTQLSRSPTQLTWFDRTGRAVAPAGDPGVYVNIDLSRDDRYVAVAQAKEFSGETNVDIWAIDLSRAGTATRQTDNPGFEFDPAWSKDGTQIAFNCSGRVRQSFSLCTRPFNSSGGGQDDVLVPSMGTISAPDWSHDGRFLVYSESATAEAENFDLWTVPLGGERKPAVFLKTRSSEASGTFSPDSRWIAYESNESGRSEVYVAPFPREEGAVKRVPVSRDGGRAPRWRGNGVELFFLALDGTLMSAVLKTTNDRWGIPKELFRTGLTRRGTFHPYAVAQDGQRFLIPVTIESQSPPSITLLRNWPAMLPK
jgi:serine/threonine protein kinase